MHATEHKWHKTKGVKSTKQCKPKIIPQKQINTMRSGRFTKSLQILQTLHFEDALDKPLGNSTAILILVFMIDLLNYSKMWRLDLNN